MNLKEWASRPRDEYRPKCARWCRQCGRKHNPRDVCNLYHRTRLSKADNKVKRWTP